MEKYEIWVSGKKQAEFTVHSAQERLTFFQTAEFMHWQLKQI
jgi:hypothetical protein